MEHYETKTAMKCQPPGDRIIFENYSSYHAAEDSYLHPPYEADCSFGHSQIEPHLIGSFEVFPGSSQVQTEELDGKTHFGETDFCISSNCLKISDVDKSSMEACKQLDSYHNAGNEPRLMEAKYHTDCFASMNSYRAAKKSAPELAVCSGSKYGSVAVDQHQCGSRWDKYQDPDEEGVTLAAYRGRFGIL